VFDKPFGSGESTELLPETASLALAYVVVTGAATAPRAAELVRGLLGLVPRVLTLVTPNAARVIAARDLSDIDGNRLVESYFDEAILPLPPLGLVVVAPCSFNSLNKLAAGIADNLALSVVAEAIGRATPVIVAPSLNALLLQHPQTAASLAKLRAWGISVVDPQDDGTGPRLAPTNVILAEAARCLERWCPAPASGGTTP
jgi:phosphopantothenoylcysteine synthetase/decarboxylase